MSSKLLTAAEAVECIRDNDTIATAGFGISCLPEEILFALSKKFLETGKPRNLTLLHAAGQGDWEGNGVDRLAHEGLVGRIIGAHFATYPRFVPLINDNKLEAYNFPQGVVAHLFRAIAARKPGEITKVGLKTFVDPRQEGGKLNRVTTKDLIEVMHVVGQEWLLYRSMPIHVTLLRGTTADEFGNISFEEEATLSDGLAAAMAAKASRGKVIAQVKYCAKGGSLPAKSVFIPGHLVDAVVLCSDPQQFHRQAPHVFYDPVFAGQAKAPFHAMPRAPLDEKKVIARRAAMELTHHAIVNLGIGTPELVAVVAAEEGVSDEMTLTVESGSTGGVPLGFPHFGLAVNPWAIIPQPDQFDFYDGGGLDITFLGLAQVDSRGNVNVSKFGPRIAGCGGFINISQNTRNVVYCGLFRSGGLKVKVGGGRLEILREGQHKKFLERVEQVTFSGEYALEVGQRVLYVTERAVFRLEKEGMTLIEIAPGVDLEKHILAEMDFKPAISKHLKLMNPAIFSEGLMGLKVK